MADVVTTQILENGPRRVVVKFTNLSDGTGESAVKKVDASSTGPYGVVQQGSTVYPTTHMKIVDLAYDVKAMQVRMLWEGTPNLDIWICSGDGAGPFEFLDSRAGFQGLINPMGSGATGSILFTTVGANLNASYSIILALTKGI